LDFSVIRH